MENKYYTPTIEEFHVGFEYEENKLFGNTWKKQEFKFTKKGVSRLIDGYEALNDVEFPDTIITEMYRVKYLDREDIESLGYKRNSWSTPEELIFETDRYVMTYFLKAHRLMISDKNRSGYFNTDKYYHYFVFDGIIKNKSELKVLLKQLMIL